MWITTNLIIGGETGKAWINTNHICSVRSCDTEYDTKTEKPIESCLLDTVNGDRWRAGMTAQDFIAMIQSISENKGEPKVKDAGRSDLGQALFDMAASMNSAMSAGSRDEEGEND